MENLKEIITLINQKNIDGYKYLYNNYYPSLCSFSFRFFKQKEDAEDIVQDVLLNLLKSNAHFISIQALTSFLYISVKNASLNEIRNNSKLTGIVVATNNDIQNLKIDDKSIEQILIEEEYYRQIYVAINKLSPERKKIILLSMEGLTNKEVAEKTNVSVNTVKTLKLKAYRFLKEELEFSVFFFLLYLIN